MYGLQRQPHICHTNGRSWSLLLTEVSQVLGKRSKTTGKCLTGANWHCVRSWKLTLPYELQKVHEMQQQVLWKTSYIFLIWKLTFPIRTFVILYRKMKFVAYRSNGYLFIRPDVRNHQKPVNTTMYIWWIPEGWMKRRRSEDTQGLMWREKLPRTSVMSTYSVYVIQSS